MPQTKAQLTSLLNSNITDALNKQNTASKVRQVIQSNIDSLGILSGSNTFVGDQIISGSVILPDVLLSSYTSNNLALEAGVPVGALYRNGNTISMATPATNPS